MANVVCGWHSMYFPDEEPPVLGEAPGCADDTHGICERCKRCYEANMPRRNGKRDRTPAERLREHAN